MFLTIFCYVKFIIINQPSTYQAIINAGEKHIKESIDKTIKDIEMDVLLHKINVVSNLKSFGMNEDDKFMIGFLGA